MKKFVGTVNGKKFDNMTDFSNAALNALTTGDENLCITSYYSDCDCDECDCEKKKLCDHISLEPDDLLPLTKDGKTTWEAPKELDDTLEHITKENRDNLVEFVNNSIRTYSQSMDAIKLKSDKLEKELAEVNKKYVDSKNAYNYYLDMRKRLSDTVYDFQKDTATPKTAEKKISSGVIRNEVEKDASLEELFGNIGEGFSKWLKDIGFWDNLK